MSKKKIIKKGEVPSKEDAESAMNIIKLRETENDTEVVKKEEEEIKNAILRERQRIELEKVAIAQERIKRKLRENLKKKEEDDKALKNTQFLESGGKISWKTNSSGKLIGYYKNKLVFEITRGMTVFNLYIKDKTLMEQHKISTSYIGCSSFLSKLKIKSEKLI
jgi:Tfp pilus assembly PilM family ATPase